MRLRFDPSAGMDSLREEPLRGPPPPLLKYAENFMLSAYDPVSDVGIWLHWGTCPDEFSLTEEQVLIALPGEGGFVWSRGYWRPEPEQRPSGHNLKYTVIEPFRRLHVSFDAIGVRTPYEEMNKAIVRDGRQERVVLDLDISALGPAWDNHVSALGGKERGSMTEQDWASEHFQQAVSVRGVLQVEGTTFQLDATGTRDHSRGQRGHKPNSFGGHNLCVSAFADGRSFGLQRMWTPQGQFSLNVGYVCIDGRMHHCDVVSRPLFIERTGSEPEPVEIVLASDLGEHVITGRIVRSLFTTRGTQWSVRFGADHATKVGFFAPGFAIYEWDGQSAGGLFERSGMPGASHAIGRPWSSAS